MQIARKTRYYHVYQAQLLAAKLKLAYHNPSLNLNWPEWIDS